ncbi:MAG: nitroreductase family deazaflavin-dependent oxidoreductase [Actinomycetota bacterium]|nr:nitroreductase family deazaflavin-dependent oxidoreductase [Actinomycetota bacterium]
MAKQYEITTPIRMVNAVMSFTSRRGWGGQHLLTTTGRKSGEPRSVPVTPLIVDGVEYLVAPYGAVGWVHNMRANPAVTFQNGREVRSCTVTEVTGQVPEVVKEYYEKIPIVRPYMDLPDSPTVEDFARTGDAYPVFRVEVD